MDRRMLIAMVLAILVLVLNSFLFGTRERPSPPAGVPADSARQEQVAPSATSPDLSPGPSVAARVGDAGAVLRDAAAEAFSRELIHVDNGLVEAVFDPVGGSIRSWKLRNYTNAEAEVADLVRTPEVGALWFALRDGSRLVRTDSTLFRSAVERGNAGTVVRFVAEDPSGIRLEKTYTLESQRYDARLDVRVEGLGESGEAFWEIGWVDGLPVLEKDPKSDYVAVSSVALFGKDYVRTHAGGGAFGCASGGGQGVKTEVHEGTLRWLGVRNRYFLGALLLDEPRDRRVVTGYSGQDHTASALMREPMSMADVTEQSYRVYLGPIHYGILDDYAVGLERVVDLGPGVLRPFSKLLMKFFVALHHIVPNYGFEILILSVLLRLLFYPLTKKSMESMRRMQQLKPQIDAMNQRFKDDPERRNREMLEMYRKNKVNPLGGCLPVLLQLPVLSGLYYVLAIAVQLRKEPFILWITDLAAPDTVARVGGFPLNILPLIMAATMLWQQKITPTDPRQASIGYLMPIFMTFLFYSTPSGLVFYWTISNLMTVLQQLWMNRSLVPVEVPAAGGAMPGASASRKGRAR